MSICAPIQEYLKVMQTPCSVDKSGAVTSSVGDVFISCVPNFFFNGAVFRIKSPTENKTIRFKKMIVSNSVHIALFLNNSMIVESACYLSVEKKEKQA